jgi:adenylate kinase family enzyme
MEGDADSDPPIEHSLSLLNAMRQRSVVIGNSGSGKSVFAGHLAGLCDVPTLDLDLLHWEGNGFGGKRDETVAKTMTHEAAEAPSWVIEGVYGWLAEVAIARATALVWLDLPWTQCREGLLARGRRRGASASDFSQLLDWAEAYWDRRTSTSFIGHSRLFEGFAGEKLRLTDRQEVCETVAWLSARISASE